MLIRMAKTSDHYRSNNSFGSRPRCRSRKRVPVERLFRDLEHNIAALATSRRYRIGNSLGRIPGLLLFRPKPRLSMDHMREIFREYNSARSGNESIPPECLAGWIKDLKDIFESFLASSRWKLGNNLVGAADFFRSSGKEIPTVAYVRELFQDYDRGLYFIPGLKLDRLVFRGDPEAGSIRLPRTCSVEPESSFPEGEDSEEAPPASGLGYRWIKACPDLSGREVCVFVAYEPDGILPEFKTSYLAALKRAGFVIVLVVALDDLNVKLVTRGLDFVDAILTRENKGFDFAAWSAVMSFVPSVWRTKLLLLANDSVFGPSESFGRLIREIRDSDADLIGLTESYEYEPHLQSYFLAFKGKALASPALQEYWSGIKAFRDKWDVIHNYETRFTSFCRGIGLKCRALFPYASVCPDPGGEYINPLHVKWRELIENGFPFIKVDLLRDFPVFADLENWEQLMLENGFSDRLVRHGIPEAFQHCLEGRMLELDAFHSSANARKINKGNYQWRNLTGLPSFYLDISQFPAGKPGWCALSIELETSLPGGGAVFEFLSDSGEKRDEPLSIPYRNNRPVTRIARLEEPLSALRFVPVNRGCRFTVKRIGYARLNENQAEMLLLDYLIESEEYRRYATRAALRKDLESSGLAEGFTLQDILLREYLDIVNRGARSAYHEWMRKAEPGEELELQRIHSASLSFVRKPVMSVILELSCPPDKDLRQTIGSVLSQTYPHWELCVTGDASILSRVDGWVAECLAGDSRVKIAYGDSAPDISGPSRRAMAMASGDFLLFLEQGERLSEQALYHFARQVNESPRASILYCDEDRISGEGVRLDPVFKPDWNPDLFLSKNYIGNAFAVRRKLAEEAGGFREGYESCRIYDLLLRCLSGLSPGQIIHIPRILYHCRFRDESEESDNAISAGIRSLEDSLRNRGCRGVTVEAGPKPGIFRVKYPLPEPPALVSLVIPTRDRLDLIKNCVESIIEKTSYKDYEILVIDNQSREKKTLKWFKKIEEENSSVRIIKYDRQFNFSSMCNLGVEKARGSIIGLVNNDIEVVNSGWLGEMVSQVSRPEIGAVGAKLYYPNGTLQHVGVITGNSDEGVPWHIHFGEPGDIHGHSDRVLTVRNYSAVTAAVMLVRKAVYLEVGGFDEMNLAVAVNDVDFCLRLIKAGYRNLWTPYAELIHHESSSRGYEITPEQKQRYAGEIEFLREQFGTMTNHDPLCNVNLKKCGSNLSLTVPGKQDN